MKKIILTLFVLGFVSLNGYSQKVYKQGGKVYLECTVANGMPAGSVTTTPKGVDGTASLTTYRDGTTITDPYASENDQVFEKLEIDNSDCLNGSSTDWVTAYNACQSKNTGGVTGWRLPTQRELMLMYIFRAPLGKMTGAKLEAIYYWSLSESSSSNSWYVGFISGSTDKYYTKEYKCKVRCVREIRS